MGLTIRMVLYAFFAMLAGQGFEFYDPETGVITIHIDDLATLIMGGIGYLGTFAWSRVAKVRGGLT